LLPQALVRRLPRTEPSGFMFGTTKKQARSSRRRETGSDTVVQALQQAFDEELRHRFARMLARDEPYLALAGRRTADRDQIQVAPVRRRTQIADRGDR
jgi:hypothetical protein